MKYKYLVWVFVLFFLFESLIIYSVETELNESGDHNDVKTIKTPVEELKSLLSETKRAFDKLAV